MSLLQHYIRIHSVFKHVGKFASVSDMQEAIALVIRYKIKSEIIGDWLYCFTSPLVGCQLEAIGFWFSYAHKAYIYSGTPKVYPATGETLDGLRAWLGSVKVLEG